MFETYIIDTQCAPRELKQSNRACAINTKKQLIPVSSTLVSFSHCASHQRKQYHSIIQSQVLDIVLSIEYPQPDGDIRKHKKYNNNRQQRAI